MKTNHQVKHIDGCFVLSGTPLVVGYVTRRADGLYDLNPSCKDTCFNRDGSVYTGKEFRLDGVTADALPLDAKQAYQKGTLRDALHE